MGSIPTGTIAEKVNTMATQAEEESCEQLCSLLTDAEDAFLEKTAETIQSDSVVMEEDGSFRYKKLSHRNSGSTWLSEKQEELARKRKELVLGLDSFNEHSLSEANRIIDQERREFRDTHTSPVGKAVRLIRGRF